MHLSPGPLYLRNVIEAAIENDKEPVDQLLVVGASFTQGEIDHGRLILCR